MTGCVQNGCIPSIADHGRLTSSEDFVVTTAVVADAAAAHLAPDRAGLRGAGRFHGGDGDELAGLPHDCNVSAAAPAKALGDLFVQVLKLCRAAGLAKLGHVALDGTKVQANASVHKAMSYARMRETEKKLAAEVSAWFARAEATDAAEIANTAAERRGDEMPDWAANKAARLERIRAAKAALEAEAKAPPPDGDEGPGPSSGMMERTSRPQRGADGGPPDRAQRNFTDPDSRINDQARSDCRSTTPRLPWTVRIRSLSLSACRPARSTRAAHCAQRRAAARVRGHRPGWSASAGRR